MSDFIEFKKDVLNGLSAPQKWLSSKYFYDEKGDDLFIQITKLPEYYLTSAENDILENQIDNIIEAFELDGKPIEIIELGAGDGHKAIRILEPLKAYKNLTFVPIDISANALITVEERFQDELPEVHVESSTGEYFSAIKALNGHKGKIVLFLGSNIGNLTDDSARDFIQELASSLSKGDKLLLGVDLKKSPEIILPAYNDSQGVTKAFNLNLLERINRELGANFDLTKFSHCPEYDMIKGEARSFLVSDIDQEVFIRDLNKSFFFKEGEKIQTEISQKYDDAKIERIIDGSDMFIKTVFKDRRNYFADYLIEKG